VVVVVVGTRKKITLNGKCGGSATIIGGNGDVMAMVNGRELRGKMARGIKGGDHSSTLE
jgi:hypothetical protein